MNLCTIKNNKNKIEEKFKNLNEEDFDKKGWITDNIFHAYINISEELRKLLDCNYGFISAEYLIDENEFNYVIYQAGEDYEIEDLLNINEVIDCSNLNSLFNRIIKDFKSDSDLKTLSVVQEKNNCDINKIQVRIISKSGNTYKGEIEGLNQTSIVLDGKNAIKLNNNSYILTDSIEYIEIL